jgi:hypothetical protein
MSYFRNLVLEQVKRLTAFDYAVILDPDLLDDEWLPSHSDLISGAAAAAAASSATGEAGEAGPPCALHRGEKDEEEEHVAAAGHRGRTVRIGGSAKAWHPDTVLAMLDRAIKSGRAPPLKAVAASSSSGYREGRFSAVCAYSAFSSERFNYDMLAFRLSRHTPIPAAAKACAPLRQWHEWNRFMSAPSVFKGRTKEAALVGTMGLFGFHRNQGFVPVESCFGGLAIYSLDALRESGCTYDEATDDCEHVALHRCLNLYSPDSVFLDTAATVYYDTESHKLDNAAQGALRGRVHGEAEREPVRRDAASAS